MDHQFISVKPKPLPMLRTHLHLIPEIFEQLVNRRTSIFRLLDLHLGKSVFAVAARGYFAF